MKREFIIVTIRRGVKRKIFVDDIIYCKAQNTYTFIKLINDSSYLISRPLKKIQADLFNYYFFRISRSYLVNMHCAIEINKKGKPTIELTNSSILNISKSKLRLLEGIIFKKSTI